MCADVIHILAAKTLPKSQLQKKQSHHFIEVSYQVTFVGLDITIQNEIHLMGEVQEGKVAVDTAKNIVESSIKQSCSLLYRILLMLKILYSILTGN